MANERQPGKKNRTNLFIETEKLSKIDYIVGMQFQLKGKTASRTDIVNEAFAEYIERFEKKHGPIPLEIKGRF